MKSYQELLSHIMANGNDRGDRTGTGTRGVFGYQWRHRMSSGFPLLTTKKLHVKSIIWELLWFMRGDTNVKFLQENGVTIWNEWADENGNLGPVYGKQWRKWDAFSDKKEVTDHCRIEIDQIGNLVRDLKANPNSRRHIVSAWNPGDVSRMALPPCHTLWQCYVQDNQLSLHLYARSIDSFLGLPFNIASYAMLLCMLAEVTDKVPGDLIISFGDLHIYSNHFDQVKEQLTREPKALPTFRFGRKVADINDFRFEDFIFEGYDPHPSIKAPIAV